VSDPRPTTIDAGTDVLARKAALTDAAARLETLGAGIRKLRLIEWPNALAGTVAADAQALAELLASLVAPVVVESTPEPTPTPEPAPRPSKSRK
jgi:hypothetical protein